MSPLFGRTTVRKWVYVRRSVPYYSILYTTHAALTVTVTVSKMFSACMPLIIFLCCTLQLSANHCTKSCSVIPPCLYYRNAIMIKSVTMHALAFKLHALIIYSLGWIFLSVYIQLIIICSSIGCYEFFGVDIAIYMEAILLRNN